MVRLKQPQELAIFHMKNQKERQVAWEFAIPGGKIEIVDENGHMINKAFEQGEILYCGANVSMGYAYTREDLSKEDELLGRLHTGDIGYKDEDGYLYIVGRKNRFIKVLGKRISLDEVEAHIKTIIAGEVYCTGRDDLVNIFIAENKSFVQKKIIESVMDFTGISKKFIVVNRMEKLQRNSSGKFGE